MNSGVSRGFFCGCLGCAASAGPELACVPAPSAAPRPARPPRPPRVSRRSFAAGAAAAVGLGTALAGGMPARLFAQAKPHRIDVHHHLSPPVWVEALKKARLDTPPVTSWTPQRSLDDMDKAATATAILSVTQPAIGFLGAAEAAAIARASNEYAKKLTQDHPGRFGMFALLPLPHADESLKEIEYALDPLKADGIGVLTSYDDKYLGDAAFAPVMDELNRRKATVYTHPATPACCVNLAGIEPIYIEYGTDTTRAIASLIFSHTSARFADINFIFSHAGGTVTALTERFTVQMIAAPKYKDFTGDGVMAELKRFYYDTAQASNPIAMAALTRMVAVPQILFGTDYPYRSGVEHVKGLAGIFGPDDLKLIDRDNALKLLPRWRAA